MTGPAVVRRRSIRTIHDQRHLAADAVGVTERLGDPGFYQVKLTSRVRAGFLEISGQRCFVNGWKKAHSLKG